MDAFITTVCALHDLRKTTGLRNSITGSVYVVKPKIFWPREVALASAIFDKVEALQLGLPANTVKLGIMDEERHQREPQGMHPRRQIAGGLHQHRLP